MFLGEDRRYAIRVGAAMKDRIKYIAVYQVSPVSAVTHLAEVREIVPYQDSGKYEVIFSGSAGELGPIPIGTPRTRPRVPSMCAKKIS